MKIWNKLKEQNWLKISISIIIGAGLGYAYYHYIGCSSGSCAITSNPINSILYGAAAGLLFSVK